MSRSGSRTLAGFLAVNPATVLPSAPASKIIQVVGALRLEPSSLGHKVKERYLHLVPEVSARRPLTDGARMPYAPDKACTP
jgi:hypothetical protein